MRKVACHRLYTRSGETLSMQVIVLDDDGIVQSWHTLEAEEEHVEWLGGSMFLLPYRFHPSDSLSPREVWRQIASCPYPASFWLWAVYGLSLSEPDDTLPCRWKRLF